MTLTTTELPRSNARQASVETASRHALLRCPVLRRAVLLQTMLLFLLAGVLPLRAQFLPNFVTGALDSALAAIAMSPSDMSMRWDAAGDDPNRLSLMRRLFSEPLASFNVADSLSRLGLDTTNNATSFLHYIGELLDFPATAFVTTRKLPTDPEIALATRITFDSLNFANAVVLRRFLSIAVATDAATITNRGAIPPDRLERLVDYCDSLLIQSEGAAEASLVEMREGERYALARNKLFFNEDVASLDHERLIAPGVTMFAMALDVAISMRQEALRIGNSFVTRTFSTHMGLVALGGAGNDIYEGDFFCIVDMGGNDIYRPSPRTKREAFKRSVTLIVDFDGDDVYVGQDYVFGGALFGASTLIDLSGNDSYSARNFSLGCGFFGTSVLYDVDGSDRYSGGTAVQGAGVFGIGLLIDRSGNDNYLAHLVSQGFGYTRGVGAIVDNQGNDSYIAASPYTDYLRYDNHYETFSQGAALGARPVASAGIGIIVEGSGNDIYSCDIYGQGTAYWFGLGAIVDVRGNDMYNAFQYAQGAGVHLAFGVLIDSSGNDNYVSHGVSQGCGHDIAFGGLYEANGDDNYVVESLSLGGGNADAISLFVDAGGEDGYLARRDNTLGYSDLRREYGMIGVFLDLERHDFYGTSRGGNDSLWHGSYYGVGLDGEIRPRDSAAPVVAGDTPHTKQEIDSILAKDIPSLFVQASAAPQKWQFIVEPARARLVERSTESLPYLLSMLNTQQPREALALGILLPRIGEVAMYALIDTVRHGDSTRMGRAIYALGQMKNAAASDAIGERLVDSTVSWRMRATAGEAILKLAAPQTRPYLKQALHDPVELVRGYATRGLLMIADSAEIIEMLPLLSDTSQIVRYQFQLGLQRRGVDSIPGAFAAALIATPDGRPHRLLMSVAYELKNQSARATILDAMLASSTPSIRVDAIRLALAWRDPASLRAIQTHSTRERDQDVRKVLDAGLNGLSIEETQQSRSSSVAPSESTRRDSSGTTRSGNGSGRRKDRR